MNTDSGSTRIVHLRVDAHGDRVVPQRRADLAVDRREALQRDERDHGGRRSDSDDRRVRDPAGGASGPDAKADAPMMIAPASGKARTSHA